MKNTVLVVVGVLAVLVLGVLSWGVGVNNGLVTADEGVKQAWSQVENVYQRRADLIPNLVNTVKGYAKHEAQVLEEVTKARASVGQVKVSQPGDLAQFDQAQQGLTAALSRLLIVAEKYPELKADKNFLELQSQLEGTENRIAVERMRFNDASKAYNVMVRRFPQSLIASMRGFQERAYFSAAPGAAAAPKVEF